MNAWAAGLPKRTIAFGLRTSSSSFHQRRQFSSCFLVGGRSRFLFVPRPGQQWSTLLVYGRGRRDSAGSIEYPIRRRYESRNVPPGDRNRPSRSTQWTPDTRTPQFEGACANSTSLLLQAPGSSRGTVLDVTSLSHRRHLWMPSRITRIFPCGKATERASLTSFVICGPFDGSPVATSTTTPSPDSALGLITVASITVPSTPVTTVISSTSHKATR